MLIFPLWWIDRGQCACPSGASCDSPGKHPLTRNGVKDATRDEAQIQSWREQYPRANWGLATGVGSGVVVIDLDRKPDRDGVASLRALAAAHGGIPRTRVVRTGSGGLHLYFRHPGGRVPNSAGKLGPGIDVRGDGGYVVSVGSTHVSGGTYQVQLDADPAELPAWLLQPGPPRSSAPAGALAQETGRGYFPPATPAVLEAARVALERHGPAIEGRGGDEHTFKAAALLVHDFALAWNEALPILQEWNEACEPPWDEADLQIKLRGGDRYGKSPYGSRRTMDSLETARKLIADWQADPGPDGQASMFAMLNRCRDLRFTDTAKRALVLRELKAATGIGVRELALPPVVNVEAQAEQAKRREDYSKSPKSNVVDTSEPLDAARRFLSAGRDSGGLPELVRWQGAFWRATGTHYEERSDEHVAGELYRFLDGKQEVATGAPVKPDRTLVEVVAHALRAAAALDAPAPPAWVSPEPDDPPAEEMLSFRNGLLHTPTRDFRPVTRRLFTLNALTFDYAPKAPRPAEWLRFLGQLWGNDSESLETLQELMGLLLTDDTSFQKIFLLVGPARSGKGTIGRVLQALVGEANYCAPTLNGLGQQHGLEALVAKRLAVISDARLSGRADQSIVVENLLRISGEDVIGVPRKYKSDWTARLRVRFLLLSNEVPALMDQSGALASRFVVLQLRRSFYGQEDRGLEAKLLTELPGILLWALEGLDRLRARGYFRQPDTGAEAVRQLEALASPVKAFIEERCELAPDATADSATLYGAWSAWCADQGRPPGTVPIFGRNLLSAFPELRVSRPRAGDKRVRVYEGLRVVSTETTR